MARSSDREIMGYAKSDGMVIVSADTDFGTLLAESHANGPSVILFRQEGRRRPGQLAMLLLSNLDSFEVDLQHGAVVVFGAQRIRIRTLPIIPAE